MNIFGLSFRQAADRFYISDETREFQYSDGEIEEKTLIELINSTSDLSAISWDLHKNINSWAQRYHLSMHRGAIIRCLPITSNARVLELGAGCGAVTRALGEKFAKVDGIEGSETRASICASRCRDLPNVRVFVADINSMIPRPDYDVVFLVGVLEWSKGYVNGAHPFQRCLQIASDSLKEDGIIVIAIENQLGIKYFLGIGEDHCGMELEGLQGYPTFHSVETFSKAKLYSLAREVGMTAVRFLYPYPDYKLTRVILTDEAVSLRSEMIAYWASRYRFEDYLRPERYVDGNQSLILSEVGKAGLLGELSNSFLALAARQEADLPDFSWLVWSERPTESQSLYSLTTLERADGELRIRKLYPHLSSRERVLLGSTFRLNLLDTQAFLQGSLVELDLLRAAMSSNEMLFLERIKDWMVYIESQQLGGNGLHLKSEAWDCIPRNLVRMGDGRIQAFDQEFANDDSIRMEDLCARGLLWWYVDNAPWVTPLRPSAKTIREHLQWVLQELFPHIDSNTLISCMIDRENRFQTLFASQEDADKISILLDSPLKDIRHPGQRIIDLETKLHDLAIRLQRSQDQFNRIRNHIVIGRVISIWRKLFNPGLP